MLMKSRAPRVKKKLFAILDGEKGIIENISSSGGFIRTNARLPEGQAFDMKLKVMGRSTIKMVCESKRCSESGIGFSIIHIKNAKEELFNQYVQQQFRSLKRFGDSRIFTTEIIVTLKDTNAFGNVYFSNYIQYQGVIREQFLLATVPDIHRLLTQTRIRLVTVDAYNKFLSNAYFGDTLIAELTTSSFKAASCRLNIRFRNKKTGELIGDGYQTFCVVQADGRVVRLPDELLEPLDFYNEIATI
ncbi:MAG: thioesterase family protein [Thermodesulfobacteriota bacterium]|nr:thioesterase family protein [Thermodesulfobacteriota bacterium]